MTHWLWTSKTAVLAADRSASRLMAGSFAFAISEFSRFELSKLVAIDHHRALQFVALCRLLHGPNGILAGCMLKTAAALGVWHIVSLFFQRQHQLIPGCHADLHLLWRRTVEFDPIVALGQVKDFVGGTLKPETPEVCPIPGCVARRDDVSVAR